MGKIILERLQFKAYHGYYEAERQLGNHFEVTVTVETDFSKASFDDELQGTVDYEVIYKIIRDEMEVPSKLLEHVVSRILDRIMRDMEEVNFAEIRLSKLKPPIGGDCYAATVIDSRSRLART